MHKNAALNNPKNFDSYIFSATKYVSKTVRAPNMAERIFAIANESYK